MTKTEELLKTILEFGIDLNDALYNSKEPEKIVAIEQTLNETLQGSTPEQLGIIGFAAMILVNKISSCNPIVDKEKYEVSTAVLTCRSILVAIENSAADFNFKPFEVFANMAINPRSELSPEKILGALEDSRLKDVDCVGSC